MHLSIALLSVGLPLAFASEEWISGNYDTSFAGPLNALFERQTRTCKSVPVRLYSCEASCGTGYRSCVYDTLCFNPSAGDTCCSSGKYCPAGYYCTSGGCCPTGETCQGAAVGTLPGYALTPTTSATSARATTSPTTTSTGTITTTAPSTTTTPTTTSSSTRTSTTSPTSTTSTTNFAAGGGGALGSTTAPTVAVTARPTSIVGVGAASTLKGNTFIGGLAALLLWLV